MADDCVVQVAPPILGTFTVSGLRNGGRILEVIIDSTSWTALPLVPLVGRNALSIQNRSGVEIKIQYDNTVTTYLGVTIANLSERMYDITDAIVIYAKSSAGTVTILVEEIS